MVVRPPINTYARQTGPTLCGWPSAPGSAIFSLTMVFWAVEYAARGYGVLLDGRASA